TTRYVLAATRPDNRKGLTPEYQTAENLKLDTGKLDELRKAGFAAMHILPEEGLACGLGSLVSTGGQTPRDSVILDETFNVFCLKALGGGTYPSTLMGATAHLRQAFLDAKHYANHWKLFRESKNAITRPPVDATLETVHQVIEGKRKPVFFVNTRDDIHRALDFCEEHNLKPILWGCRDAYLCLDRLTETKTDLILELDFGEMPKIEKPDVSEKLTADVKDPIRVQENRQAEWLARVRSFAEMLKRGLRFGVTARDLKNQAEVLNALRTLVEHGLTQDIALAALTTQPAAILGVSDRMGTLEAGKLGSVVVMTKPFDAEKTKVRYVFVDGRQFEYNSDEKPSTKKSNEEKTEDSPLLGTWKLTIQNQPKPTNATLKLTQDDKKLGGTFRSSQGNGNVVSAKTKSETIEFTVQFGKSNDEAVKFQFTGKLDGEQLAGEMKIPFAGSTKWTAIRESSDEENPKSSPSKPAVATRYPENELPTELDSDRLSRPFQTSGNVLVKNATVLTGTGKMVEGGSVLIRNGKIAAVGKNLKPDAGMRVIDATGKFVMPGIIDT
ncbi:MAG: amidohydrolase family protein, partial [Planctomycetaceae bacterium]|nr:amidohydrolase family protein [Planctomycetaceae bacterium]